MPRPNELGAGEGVNSILARRFEIQPNPAPYMGSELFPCIVLENDRPEYHWLGGSRLYAARRTDAATAANFSIVGLSNPAGSGVLAVLEKIVFENNDAGVKTFQVFCRGAGALAAFDAQAGAISTDSRNGWSTAFRSACQVGDLTQAATTGQLMFNVEVPATSMFTLDWPFILGPQSQVLIIPTAVNLNSRAQFFWRERTANPAELTGAK